MNNAGYVYVLINASMEGLIKVGMTTREPKERAEELSKATGVPTPFIVAYQMYVSDCSKAEAFVHTFLESKGYRVSSNREFFNAPLTEAINGILQYTTQKKYNVTDDSEQTTAEIRNLCNPWEEIETLASNSFTGKGETLKDHKEALKLYKQAYKLNSPSACEMLGFIYKLGLGCQSDEDTALDYLKEGIRREWYRCYEDMIDIYINQKEYNNALKCWDFYITKVESPNPSVCRQYIDLCYNFDLPIGNRNTLITIKDEILSAQTNYIANLADYSPAKQVSQEILNYMYYFLSVDQNERVLTKQEWKNYKIRQYNEKVAKQNEKFYFIAAGCAFVSFFISCLICNSLAGIIILTLSFSFISIIGIGSIIAKFSLLA